MRVTKSSMSKPGIAHEPEQRLQYWQREQTTSAQTHAVQEVPYQTAVVR